MNCPYPAWPKYFPDQAYSAGSRHSQLVQAFLTYFQHHLGELPVDDVSLHCSLPVDAATLLQDSSLSTSLPDLAELVKDQPETTLNCMAVALHTVLCASEGQSQVLPVAREDSGAQDDGSNRGSDDGPSRDLNDVPGRAMDDCPGSSSAACQSSEEVRGTATVAGMAESEVVDDFPRLYIRLYNLGPVIPLKSIKAPLFGKCVEVQGTVVRVSNIKPLVTTLCFSCSFCQATQALLLTDGKYAQPTKCPNPECRGRTFVPQRSSPLTQTIDWQTIKIQELAEDDRREAGRIPRTIECELTSDLVDSCIPGDMVTITAVVKASNSEEASRGRGSKDKCMFVLYLQAISVIANKGQSSDSSHGPHMEFSTKDYYAISEIHSDKDVFKLIVGSFCPTIYGHELVKAGLILGLFGGSQRHADPQNTIPIRADPHVLVVGDPGLGKSQMLQSASSLAPRGVYVCGNTTTTSGLTVTLSKEAGGSGEFALEAGALVLADQGCCCIDEFDKMGSQHQALLEAMEQQSISIAKAGVVCSLPARTAILAAANPVGGHYNKAKTVSENLKMSGALLSRFDLVFILLDRPDEEMDCLLSEHVMSLHGGRSQEGQGTSMGRGGVLRATARRTREGSVETSLDQSSSLLLAGDDENNLGQRLKVKAGEDFDPIPIQLLRKYIGYARKYVHPRIGDEAAQVLQTFYLELRRQRQRYDSTPITTRQLESLIRLTEARARLSLREEATGEDARDVVQIMKFSMNDTFSDEYGVLDFDRSQHGSGMSQRAQGKRFVRELGRVADSNGCSTFTVQQMRDIAKNIGLQMGNFEDLIYSLNNQNYLLKKGPKLYQLQTASCL